MYFWMRWRETLGEFILALCIVGSLAVAVIVMSWVFSLRPPTPVSWEIDSLWQMCLLTGGFAGLLFGGRSIAAESVLGAFPDFILTRPRSRKYFIWVGWAAGLAATLAILAIIMLLAESLLFHDYGFRWWRLLAAAPSTNQGQVIEISVLLAFAPVFAMFVYSTTYLMSVLTRRQSIARGVTVGFGFAYQLFAAHVRWAQSHLPGLWPTLGRGESSLQLLDLHAVKHGLILWIICALLFTFVAQLAFESHEASMLFDRSWLQWHNPLKKLGGVASKCFPTALGEGREITYVRKCWRDTALTFYLGLGVLLVVAVISLKDVGPHSAPAGNALLAMVVAWVELGFAMGLFACFLGFRTIGTDLQKGLGDFLLTRPLSRKLLIWTGWAVGIAEIACIFLACVLLAAAILYQENAPFWRHLPATVVLDQQLVAVDLLFLVASIFVFAALAFSTTYFVSVSSRGRGPMLVFWLLIAYQGIMKLHGWWYSPIPGILVQPYYAVLPHAPQYAHITEICTLFIWILCTLAFPYLAQRKLERMDI